MNRTPEIIDRLVTYVSDMKSRKVTIKPKGAFKESKHFYAVIEFNEWNNASLGNYLLIRCHNINNHGSSEGTCIFSRKLINQNYVYECISECLGILDNITFSIADGCFHKNDEKLPGTEFKEIMNELWSMDEDVFCSVCSEKTVTQTPCGHNLCIICWSIINETKPRCPMCRNNIKYREAEPISDSESDVDN